MATTMAADPPRLPLSTKVTRHLFLQLQQFYRSQTSEVLCDTLLHHLLSSSAVLAHWMQCAMVDGAQSPWVASESFSEWLHVLLAAPVHLYIDRETVRFVEDVRFVVPHRLLDTDGLLVLNELISRSTQLFRRHAAYGLQYQDCTLNARYRSPTTEAARRLLHTRCKAAAHVLRRLWREVYSAVDAAAAPAGLQQWFAWFCGSAVDRLYVCVHDPILRAWLLRYSSVFSASAPQRSWSSLRTALRCRPRCALCHLEDACDDGGSGKAAAAPSRCHELYTQLLQQQARDANAHCQIMLDQLRTQPINTAHTMLQHDSIRDLLQLQVVSL